MKRLFYVCPLICAAFVLSGCHTEAGKRAASVAQSLRQHNDNAKIGAPPRVEKIKKSAAKAFASKVAHTGTPASRIGMLSEPGASAYIEQNRYAVAERRYMSLTGQPCVAVTVGSYNGIGDGANENDMMNSPFFTGEERQLSCKHNGVWAMFPYYGNVETGE